MTAEIGKLFLRIIGTDVDLVSSFSSISEESRRHGQVLILKEIKKIKEPTHEQQIDDKIVESGTREEVELLASHLGKVFVDIGLTLPSGHNVEDARRNDAIALSIGSRAIQNATGIGGLLKSNFTRTDTRKTELLATAMGRILMHLRGASQLMTARMDSPEIEQSRDSSILALGRLTLQMIEQSASNKIERFEVRRQGDDLVRKLGLAVFTGASSLSAQSFKPFLEEAKRNVTENTVTNKFTGTGAEQTASTSPSTLEESKKHVLVQKQVNSIQSSVNRSRPTKLHVKQPFAESKELHITGTPSIDVLPSKTRLSSSRTKNDVKRNIELNERSQPQPFLNSQSLERPEFEKEKPRRKIEMDFENENEEPTMIRKKKKDFGFTLVRDSNSEEKGREEQVDEPTSVWKQKK